MSVEESDLILHYYGEAPEPEAVERRLAASPAARRRYAEIARLLDAVDAAGDDAPPPFHAARTWARLEPELRPRSSRRRPAPLLPRLAGLAALTLLLVAAFAAGWWTRGGAVAPRGEPVSLSPGALSPAARGRILAAAATAHLEAAERLLAEVENGSPAGLADGRRRRAAELVDANRLYRLAARRAGERALAELLEDVERFLLELSHPPAGSAGTRSLGDRLRADDLLFRVRAVTGARRPGVAPGGATL